MTENVPKRPLEPPATDPEAPPPPPFWYYDAFGHLVCHFVDRETAWHALASYDYTWHPLLRAAIERHFGFPRS